MAVSRYDREHPISAAGPWGSDSRAQIAGAGRMWPDRTYGPGMLQTPAMMDCRFGVRWPDTAVDVWIFGFWAALSKHPKRCRATALQESAAEFSLSAPARTSNPSAFPHSSLANSFLSTLS